jgi:hypothetical protein
MNSWKNLETRLDPHELDVVRHLHTYLRAVQICPQCTRRDRSNVPTARRLLATCPRCRALNSARSRVP